MSLIPIQKNCATQTPAFNVDVVLECARAIAALWVFMFHIVPVFAPWPLLATIARYGHQGVPLFFVISGYCMMAAAENTLKSQRQPNNFLQRRLLRIFPPFWISVLAVMAAPYIIEGVSAVKSGVFAVAAPAWMAYTWIDWIELLTLTKVFGNPGGDLQAAFAPINAVYWSLAIEVQFYLVMYASLFFKMKWKKILLGVTLLSILTAMSPSLAESGFFMKYWPAFFVGVLLREAHTRGITPAKYFGPQEMWGSLIATSVLLAGLMTVIFAAPCSTLFSCSTVPNLTFTLAAVLSALMLWTFGGIEHALRCRAAAGNLRFFRAWMLLPLAWIGQSSYSLYLLHGKIYQLPMMFVRQLVPPTSPLYPLLIICGTAVICYVFYLVAERPFHQLAKNLEKSRTARTLAPTPEVAAGTK